MFMGTSTAPNKLVLNHARTISMLLGNMISTLSPGCTPSPLNPPARRRQCSYNPVLENGSSVCHWSAGESGRSAAWRDNTLLIVQLSFRSLDRTSSSCMTDLLYPSPCVTNLYSIPDCMESAGPLTLHVGAASN